MPVGCMEFLTKKRPPTPPPIVVVFGDEDYLRRQAAIAVREWAVGPEPDDFTYAPHVGAEAKLATILDELSTPPFLGDRRLSYVEDADKFVTQHRESLFKYANSPSDCGVLLMEVRTWASNTKLAKAVEDIGLAIDCKSPQAWRVGAWCVQWAEARHGKKLAKTTADWLVELVGVNLGQLDQELQKLATFVGAKKEIDMETVQRLTAGTRTETMFKLLDLAVAGDLKQALEYLDRSIIAGESEVGILAMVTSQLRKLTRAAREVVGGKSMDEALSAAGIPPFAMDKARGQLKHFGRLRMAAMYRHLLRVDLDVKGGSPLPPRIIVERFLIDLASTGNVKVKSS